MISKVKTWPTVLYKKKSMYLSPIKIICVIGEKNYGWLGNILLHNLTWSKINSNSPLLHQ